MLNNQVELFAEQIRIKNIDMTSKDSVIQYIESFGGKCISTIVYGKSYVRLLNNDIRFEIPYNWKLTDAEIIWELMKSLGLILMNTSINESNDIIEWISDPHQEKSQKDAEIFAATMIIPKKEFHEFYQETSRKQYGRVLISDIAAHFNTINKAVILRGQEFGYYNDN